MKWRLPLALSALLLAAPTEAATSIGLNVSVNGVFDPSLADTPVGATNWISYSAVDPSPQWPTANSRTVATRIASSPVGGGLWTDAGVIVNPISEVNADPSQRTWINEVSTVVYDASAASGARWKLWWHHYSEIANHGEFANGWLAYKEASTPAGLVGATEIKLLVGTGYDTANNTQGGTTGSPLGGAPLIAGTDIGLSDCIAFSEPGAVVAPDAIYIAITCFTSGPSRVTLLRCTLPCSAGGANWTSVGTLLTEADAALFGAVRFTAADLFIRSGIAYLMVSPVGTHPTAGAYNGCDVMRVNLPTATVARDGGGTPIIATVIRGTPGSFNGDCTFAPTITTGGGYLYGELTMGVPISFGIFILPTMTLH